jgi:arylsulfatase A-like enzyme
VLTLALLCVLAGSDVSGERQPNIVLLYTDDAGYADFGFQAEAEPDVAELTPNIDSIARAGVTFTNAYASGCACSPARAGLLTGRYQTRFGHENNLPEGFGEGGLPRSEQTMADRLRALGYRTGLVGKWHLGYAPGDHPNERGFDWFYGLIGSAREYVPLEDPSPYEVILEDGERTPEAGYLTDRLGDAAVHFIRKNRKRPFFLMVAFTAPHGPVQPRPFDLPARENVDDWPRARYAGVVKCLDQNVGKILQELEDQRLTRDTLVVFTNDNGSDPESGARNGSLVGQKGSLSEGGIRVPLCLRWPGRVPRGRTVPDAVIALDLLPTFVAAAGGEVDEDWGLDGVDLLPHVSARGRPLETRALFWRSGGTGGELALRLGRHKLHVPAGGGAPRLYDLALDSGEQEDLAGREPERAARLRARLASWEAEQVEPLWDWERTDGER